MKPAFFLACALLSAQALACGVCVEDKVASCYDHEVIEQARARGNEVAFFALQGALPRREATRAMLRRAIESSPAVVRQSTRISLENAAISFAYDPRRANVVAIADSLERRLQPAGLTLGLLRVVDR